MVKLLVHLINADEEAKHAINSHLRFRYKLFVVISKVQSSLIPCNERRTWACVHAIFACISYAGRHVVNKKTFTNKIGESVMRFLFVKLDDGISISRGKRTPSSLRHKMKISCGNRRIFSDFIFIKKHKGMGKCNHGHGTHCSISHLDGKNYLFFFFFFLAFTTSATTATCSHRTNGGTC